MSTIAPPLSQKNPEPARRLTLSSYYLRIRDFRRATDYARLPSLGGDGQGVLNLLTTLVRRREYTAAIEMAGTLLKMPVAGEWQHPIERLENDFDAFLHRAARGLSIPSQYLAPEEPVSTQNAQASAPQPPEPKTAAVTWEAA